MCLDISMGTSFTCALLCVVAAVPCCAVYEHPLHAAGPSAAFMLKFVPRTASFTPQRLAGGMANWRQFSPLTLLCAYVAQLRREYSLRIIFAIETTWGGFGETLSRDDTYGNRLCLPRDRRHTAAGCQRYVVLMLLMMMMMERLYAVYSSYM